MDYAIQMYVSQASGSPEVVNTSIEKGRPLDEVIMIAKARLKMALADGKIITDQGGTIDVAVVGTGAVFIRVVELEDGSPTGPVVFSRTLAELG